MKLMSDGGHEGGGGTREGRTEEEERREGQPFPGLTLGVFLAAVAVLLLVVGQLGLLVGLVLAHVAVVPVVVRQLGGALRIYRGLVLVKEAA